MIGLLLNVHFGNRQNIQSVNLLQQSDIIDEVTEEPWLRNEMYILKKEEQHLLLSKDAWLNDRIMNAAQKLIFKKIVTDESYQSVLTLESRIIVLPPPLPPIVNFSIFFHPGHLYSNLPPPYY